MRWVIFQRSAQILNLRLREKTNWCRPQVFPRWHFALALTYCFILFPIFPLEGCTKYKVENVSFEIEIGWPGITPQYLKASLISDRFSCSEAKVIEIELKINRWSVINAYPTAVRWRVGGEKEVGIVLSWHKRYSTLRYGKKKYKDAYYKYNIRFLFQEDL